MSDTSLSGVGGAPAAEQLPRLDSECWCCKTADKKQKQQLLAYAAQRGMAQIGHSDLDSDLGLLIYNGRLVSTPLSLAYLSEQQVTPDQFKAMCDAYAAR
jgi:hypothetical protein